MSITLTIDVFSGRPNPTVVVEGPQERQLLERLRPEGDAEPEAAAPFSETALGYRGILVEIGGRRPRWLPASFRVVNGLGLQTEKPPFVIADLGFEDYLCSTDGPFQFIFWTDPGLLKLLRKELKRWQEKWIVWKPPLEPGDWPLLSICHEGPPYEPDMWNTFAVKHSNSDYNYATNMRTDTFAYPGKAQGPTYGQINCRSVGKAAVADGLIEAPDADNVCPDEGHLIALVTYPADSHWLRKGRNGFWSHKPFPVTNLDNSSKLIADPRDADLGPYSFCTFMIARHGHFRIY